jgi:hypothetical protein
VRSIACEPDRLRLRALALLEQFILAPLEQFFQLGYPRFCHCPLLMLYMPLSVRMALCSLKTCQRTNADAKESPSPTKR